MHYEIPALDERPFQPSELPSNHHIHNGQATVPVRQAIKYRALGQPIHLIGVEFSRDGRNIVGFEIGEA